MYRKILKPFLIYAMVGFVLIISFVILLITVMLFVKNDRSVFFNQKRSCLRRTVFQIIKSKAINVPSKNSSFLLGYTRFIVTGNTIKNPSQDEYLPLIPILKGEKSLLEFRTLLNFESLFVGSKKVQKRYGEIANHYLSMEAFKGNAA